MARFGIHRGAEWWLATSLREASWGAGCEFDWKDHFSAGIALEQARLGISRATIWRLNDWNLLPVRTESLGSEGMWCMSVRGAPNNCWKPGGIKLVGLRSLR